MKMNRTTEQDSNYTDLDKMSTAELLHGINNEDKTVPLAVEKVIPEIEKLVNAIVEKVSKGGRLFYIGAGTSGRLGILDASECPPTYGVPVPTSAPELCRFWALVAVTLHDSSRAYECIRKRESRSPGATSPMLS